MNRRHARYTLAAVAALVMLSIFALSSPAAPVAPDVRVIVFKSKRVLMVIGKGGVLGVWPISLGANPTGPKREEGDGRTPEGDYVIDGRVPNSRYHLSLHLSYPNAADIERAHELHRSPGGDIAIHGRPNDYHPVVAGEWPGDWTDGCVALDNSAIEAVSRLVDVGTPVTIRP
jgi:murein L,D-transpeptidase YafK